MHATRGKFRGADIPNLKKQSGVIIEHFINGRIYPATANAPSRSDKAKSVVTVKKQKEIPI